MNQEQPSLGFSARMQIPIVTGTGCGCTLLSAFDGALFACGIHNYNVIPLSSVIPAAAEVVPVARYVPPLDEHGHRLYVVRAEVRSDRPGEAIAAGVGWYQWGDGRGLFVEHEVVGATREAVVCTLRDLTCHSLRDLCYTRGVPFVEQRVRLEVACAEVRDRPTSALVVAIFGARGWRSDEEGDARA